jgi:hypothetical protein
MPAPATIACPACGKDVTPLPRRRRKCPNCGEWVPPRGEEPAPALAVAAGAKDLSEEELRARVEEAVAERDGAAGPVARFADYKMFRSRLSPWESLFQQAADFATQVGPGRLISISHSQDDGEALVTVWYWREALEVQSSGP